MMMYIVSLKEIPTDSSTPDRKPFRILVWISAKKTGPIKMASRSPKRIPLNNGYIITIKKPSCIAQN